VARIAISIAIMYCCWAISAVPWTNENKKHCHWITYT